jgi:phosphoserine phosphatase RsbU/P
MDQKKLHKTVESIASQTFSSEKEMLVSVLYQIVENDKINVTGGRIWKLEPEEEVYKLLYQTGSVDGIDTNFKIRIEEYPLFEMIAKERTILDQESHAELKKKGVIKFSASGIGEKIKVKEKSYYEYIIALDGTELGENLRLTLNIIATALTSQIKQRRFSASADSLRAGLDKARELQKSILPEHEYRFHNYEIFGVTVPADIVGGDFFDYLEIGDDNDRIGIIVGDAASHGIAAAAEAMYISGAVRMASSFEIKIAPLMKRVNQLVNKIFADDKFASLFYGEVSKDIGGLFLYANAGHNPPFFIKADSDEIIQLPATGPVLGPAPHAKYSVENINFNLGDILLIYSDGITEASDFDYEQYGDERLCALLRKIKQKSPKEICYAILDDVIRFAKNPQYSDDKTMVVIKRII